MCPAQRERSRHLLPTPAAPAFCHRHWGSTGLLRHRGSDATRLSSPKDITDELRDPANKHIKNPLVFKTAVWWVQSRAGHQSRFASRDAEQIGGASSGTSMIFLNAASVS